MSSLSPSRSRSADNVIGVLPRPRRQHWLARPMLHYTRVVAAAILGAAVGLACLAGAVRPGPPRTRPAVRTLAVKRPLPEGVSERDVVKWVPLRQPSGRTELAPWTSTDAELVHDPQVLKHLLVPAPAEPSASDRDLARLEEEADDAAKAAAAAPKPGAAAGAKREKPSPPLPAAQALAPSAGATKAQGADPAGRRPSLASEPSIRTGRSPLIASAVKPSATDATRSRPVSPHPQPVRQAARPHDDDEPHARPQ